MARFNGRQEKTEISALLETFMYLDMAILKSEFIDLPVSKIVDGLDKEFELVHTQLSKEHHEIFHEIKQNVESNRDIYDNIMLASGSNHEGFPMTDLIGASFVDTRNDDVYIAFRGADDGNWKAPYYTQQIMEKYHREATNVISAGHLQDGNPTITSVETINHTVDMLNALTNKVEFDINDLRSLCNNLIDLTNHWHRCFRVIDDVKNTARRVSSESDQSYVKSAADDVSALALSISNAEKEIYCELKDLENGLRKTIIDYQNLEMGFI